MFNSIELHNSLDSILMIVLCYEIYRTNVLPFQYFCNENLATFLFNHMTTTLKPQFINDAKGKRSFVILTAKEFDAIIEELEDAEDVRLYNEAKKEDTGERIPIDEAFTMIENKRNGKNNGVSR